MTSTSGNSAKQFCTPAPAEARVGRRGRAAVQAWRLGSPQIDDQLELSQLLDRQIGSFRAFRRARLPSFYDPVVTTQEFGKFISVFKMVGEEGLEPSKP